MDSRLQFSADFKLEAKQLVLTYEVKNLSTADAYLLNRLYQSVSGWSLSPDIIYIRFDRNTETVLLSKRIPELPAGTRVTSPVAPFVTPLRAGLSFREQVHIPLPVHEYLQYPEGPGSAPTEERKLVLKQIRFRLDYYWRPEGTTEEIRDVGGAKVTIPHTPPGKALVFGVLETPPSGIEIPAVDFFVAVASQRQ